MAGGTFLKDGARWNRTIASLRPPRDMPHVLLIMLCDDSDCLWLFADPFLPARSDLSLLTLRLRLLSGADGSRVRSGLTVLRSCLSFVVTLYWKRLPKGGD